MRNGFSVLCCTIFAASALAQQINSGAVSGSVTDSSGAVMPNVKVVATSPALQGEATFKTTGQGEYRFPALPLGTYRISFEAPGFATQVRDKVAVSLGFAAQLNITMTPASQGFQHEPEDRVLETFSPAFVAIAHAGGFQQGFDIADGLMVRAGVRF